MEAAGRKREEERLVEELRSMTVATKDLQMHDL
jgi:hypothetical protein